MTNSTQKIAIQYPATGEIAPLLVQYASEHAPQPANIHLDLETGQVWAAANGEIGNAVPATVFNGTERTYAINPNLTTDQVASVLDDAAELLQTVYSNSETTWDGSNWVGVLGEAAEDAERELENDGLPLGHDLEQHILPAADFADWIMAAGDMNAWMPQPEDEVSDFIENFDMDGLIFDGNLADELRELWAQHLYNGDDLPANVARDLLEDGRCEDSEWMDELKEFASQ